MVLPPSDQKFAIAFCSVVNVLPISNTSLASLNISEVSLNEKAVGAVGLTVKFNQEKVRFLPQNGNNGIFCLALVDSQKLIPTGTLKSVGKLLVQP